MPTLPTTEWNAALDRMAVALTQTLGDLDRYQAAWAILTDSRAPAVPPEHLLVCLERGLAQWDDRLKAAAELADSVENQLEDREAAVERWHDGFVRWKELIQRKVGATSISQG
jgi:hypothetical protein